ncbi:hypothetical protein QTP88_013127 [Uroleucon formosanum]
MICKGGFPRRVARRATSQIRWLGTLHASWERSSSSRRSIGRDGKKSLTIDISVKTDLTEIKKKKDSLIATYRKLLNKVRASKGIGSGAKDVYKPDWFAYNAMTLPTWYL